MSVVPKQVQDDKTKEFLDWHHGLSADEKAKFQQVVTSSKRQSSVPNGAVKRRLGKYDSSNYDSTALDAKKTQGNVSFMARRVGDVLSPKNPKGLTRDVGKKAAALGRGITSVSNAVTGGRGGIGVPKISLGGGSNSGSKPPSKLKTSEEKWAYTNAKDHGASDKEALKAAAKRRLKN